ncbi:MAG: hypothetical protein K6G56_07360 [Clostridiales bacterium]|nr:hypothetical protein [Clostridiales bacterium]
MRKLLPLLIILGAILLAAAGAFLFWIYPAKIRPAQEYNRAASLEKEGDYVLAALTFESLGGLKDSGARAKAAWVKAGDAAYEAGELARARTFYLKGGAGEDALASLDAAYYRQGVQAYAANDRASAENSFSGISAGSRYLGLLDQARLGCVRRLVESGELEAAEKVCACCTKASAAEISALWMDSGRVKVEEKDAEAASYCFARAVAYSENGDAALQSISLIWRAAAQRAEAAGDAEFAAKCRERIGE